MTWDEAVQAMKQGAHVHRASEQKCELVGYHNGLPIYDGGTEALMLAAAWTADGKPVFVFQGVESKAMTCPGTDETKAVDWQISWSAKR